MPKNGKYVTYREFISALENLQREIAEIKTNHLEHLKEDIEKLNDKLSTLHKMLYLNYVIIIIVGILAGINVIKILGVI